MFAALRILLVVCCIHGFVLLPAQTTGPDKKNDTATRASNDSGTVSFVQKMQQFAAENRKKSAEERESDKASMVQDEVFENLKKTIQHAKAYLKNGSDTTGISEDMANINNWYAIAGDGIFTNKGSYNTYRNLTTSYNLLLVLEKRTLQHKNNLDAFQKRIMQFRYQIDSLASDSTIFSFSSDSATLSKYLQKLLVLAYEVAPIDSLLKTAIDNVQTLQTKVNLQVYKIASSIEEIELYQRQLYHSTFKQEFPYIWQPVKYNRPFSNIAYYAAVKSWLTLRFYVQNNWAYVGIILLLTILSAIYLHSLKRMYRQKGLMVDGFKGQLVLRYPTLSAIVIVWNVFQFIFPTPPFVLNAVMWTVSAISLSIIFNGFIVRYWMRIWLVLLLLFAMACCNNLILQNSRPERLFMLLLALAGIVTGVVVLVKRVRWSDLREQWIVYFIGFLTLLEFFSIIANCYGRYNLSKTLLTSGYFNVIIAIMFLWTVRLINEGLALAYVIYTGKDKKLFYINFKRVGRQAPTLFYVFLVVGWVILFGRNFYAFNLIITPIKNFLAAERNVGDYSFTINTMLLFVCIMGLSVIVSRVVSYFASDRHLSAAIGNDAKEKAGLGSWLLLIRISIISLGLFFAFAAAGIPMNRIAIILGALGVGIGFGLQTLVNNLVSGLIIAFEKPVNVGDIVEIDNQAGTMKSIGFRSSIIATWDGADMVMPNGDLLNAHLINWSLGGNKRRMGLVVGVAYDTDLENAKQLLEKVMDDDQRILKYPSRTVLFQEFNDYSVDIKLFFWVNDFKDGLSAKSDLILAIHQAFKQNNITIPFPQQDINLHMPPPIPPEPPEQ